MSEDAPVLVRHKKKTLTKTNVNMSKKRPKYRNCSADRKELKSPFWSPHTQSRAASASSHTDTCAVQQGHTALLVTAFITECSACFLECVGVERRFRVFHKLSHSRGKKQKNITAQHGSVSTSPISQKQEIATLHPIPDTISTSLHDTPRSTCRKRPPLAPQLLPCYSRPPWNK